MKFGAILFDLDGTLLNTLEDLADSVNAAMAYGGYPPHTMDEVKSYVNNGARRLIERACPAGTQGAAIDACLGYFEAHYKQNMNNKTRPYPGVLAMLQQLKAMHVKCAVVSNKFDGAVKPLCARYFGDLVDAAIGEHEQDGIRRKPWPDTVFEALRVLQVDASQALYVGDSNVDVETARNAGLACLAVTWGFRSRESLVEAGATHFADRVDQLIDEAARIG
ncbi:MAG: HAD hydrolase-like protein [Clostridia bacterium]